MNPDLDTPATALYVCTDDLLAANLHELPQRAKVGMTPELADSELLTLATMWAQLGLDPRGTVRSACAPCCGETAIEP